MIDNTKLGTSGHLMAWGSEFACAGGGEQHGYAMRVLRPLLWAAFAVQIPDGHRSASEHQP